MAGEIFGDPITITGTPSSLTSLLGLSAGKWFCDLTIRAAPANAGTIWVGRSNLTATTHQLGYIEKREAIDASLQQTFFRTDDLFLVASSPGDVAYVLGVS